MKVLNFHLEGKTPFYETEHRLRHKSGQWVWVLDKGKVIERNNEGKPLRACGTQLDITERKKMERVSSRWVRLIEGSVNEIYIFNAETLKFIQVNSQASENLGYSLDELYKMTPMDLKPEYPRDRFESLIAPLRSGETDDIFFETYHLRKDGTTYPVEVRFQIFRDENPPIFMSIILDIADRLKSEQQINILSEALKQSTVAILITDINGNIEYVNPSFTKSTGYSLEEVKGKNPRFLKSGETSKEEYKVLWDTILSGKEWRGVFHNKRKNGSFYWGNAIISALKNEMGKITHFIAINEDITERKKAKDELDKSKTLLLRSEKLSSVGTLSAGVAHEILNPLNIIGIMVQMELIKEQSAETRERLEKITTQIGRATKITNALREFSHQKEDEITRLNIHEVFDKTASLIEPDLNMENITLERDYDENLPEIDADEDKLAQVFLNLLKNAKEAMEGGLDNRITIQTKLLKDDRIKIRISDTGPGIPEDIIDKIFDPFFTTKEPGKGTGLGLSVIHGIIEKAGGDLHVESGIIGKGATFIIQLPIRNPQRESNV